MAEQISNTEKVFAKERRGLLSFIRSFVSSKEDAEDILQDVFFQFINYTNIAAIEKINSWLFKTAKNKIIDSGRKKKSTRFSELLNELIFDEETFSFEDFLPSLNLTPDELFLKDEFNEKFEAALGELPVEQRDVFLMTEIDGLSFNEISELTGITVNTLLSRKHYAVKQLKKKLNKYING